MATLTIRNLDDAVVQALKLRARANNRSLEAEARTLLERHARAPSTRELVALADEIAALTPAPSPAPAAASRDGRAALLRQGHGR